MVSNGWQLAGEIHAEAIIHDKDSLKGFMQGRHHAALVFGTLSAQA